MAAPVRKNFIAQQFAFTAHLREPNAAPPPPDVSPARLNVYRELFYRNFDSSLSACFPVLKSILGLDRWDTTVQDFFARHRCVTPIYRELPREFLTYLDGSRAPIVDEPPFLHELAQYEWVELMLTLDPADIDEDEIDRGGDLLAGVPLLSPLARVLNYRFPVHRLSPDFVPATPQEVPTHLVVYRNRNDDIGFLEINALTAALLAVFGQDCTVTGAQALEQVATAFPQLDSQLVREGGAQTLQMLRDKDVILGTRK